MNCVALKSVLQEGWPAPSRAVWTAQKHICQGFKVLYQIHESLSKEPLI